MAGAGRHPRPAHRRHHGHRRDHRALLPLGARAVGGARQLGRGGQGVQRRPRQRLAQPPRARVARARLLQRRGVAEALRHLREDGRHRPRRRGHGRLLRAHGEDRAGRPRRPREGDRPVGPRHRHPRRGSDRARRAGEPARARRAVARARRRPRADGARHARAAGADSALPAARPHLGREAAPRAQRARGVAEGARDRPDRHPGAARAGGGLQVDAGVGGARRDAAQADRHRHRPATWTSSELIELYAELGALQGEILMRPQEAIDAWQKVLRAQRPRLPRARGARAAVHAGGALGGVHRRPRAEGERARRSDGEGRGAAAGRVGVGRQDRRPRPRGRRLRAHPAARRAEHDGVVAARAGLSGAGQRGRSSSSCSSRASSSPREASERVQILQKVAEIYENEVGDQEGAFVVLQAAFRENYADQAVSGELERLATATNKWNELLGEYTQVRAADPRAGDGGGPVGQDRPLVRRAPRAPRLRDRLRAAGARARAREHRGAREPGRLLPQEVDVVGAGVDARQARRARRTSRRRRSSCTWRWPSCGKARSATRRRRSASYQSALEANPQSMDGAQRARAALPRLAAVAGPDRDPVEEGGRARGHRRGHPPQAPDRAALRGAARRRRAGDRDATRRSCRSIRRTSRRSRRSSACTRRPATWSSTSTCSSSSSTSRAPTTSASRSTSAWRRRGRSSSASPSAPGRRSRRSCSSTIATSRRCRRSSGLYRQERRSAELVETLRRHINAVNDPARAHRPLRADGPGLRRGPARHRPGGRGLQRHPQLRRRQQRAPSARCRACTRRSRTGTAPSRRRRGSSSSPTTSGRASSCTSASAASTRSGCAIRTPPRARYAEALALDPSTCRRCSR